MSLETNLVAFYPFNAMGQHTAALDHVGGRHLTSDGSSGVFPLHPEGGFAFDGASGSPTDVLTDSFLDFERLGDRWSLAFDLFHDGDQGAIFSKDAPLAVPNEQRSIRLISNADGTLRLFATTESSTAADISVNYIVNQWQRVLITKSENGIRLRVEGNESTAALTEKLRTLEDVPLLFGTFEGSTGSNFDTAGGIKNLMFWDRLLEDDERDELMTSGFIPPLRWEAGDTFSLMAVGGQSLVSGQTAGTPVNPEIYERDDVSLSSTLYDVTSLQRFHYEGRAVIGVGPELGLISATDLDGIVIHGVSGTNLAVDWNSAGAGGPQWNVFRVTVNRVFNDLESLGLVPLFEQMFWFQGTGDVVDDARTAAYADNLRLHAIALRTFLRNPELVIGVSHDWDDQVALDFYGPNITAVRNQKTEVAADDDLMVLIDQTGFERVDQVHMTWQAVTAFGIEAVARMNSIVGPVPEEIADIVKFVRADLEREGGLLANINARVVALPTLAAILQNPMILQLLTNAATAATNSGGEGGPSAQGIVDLIERENGPLDKTFKSGDTIQHADSETGAVQATVTQTKV